jgi:hypothetical protein
MTRRASLLVSLLLLGSTFAVSVSAASPWEPIVQGEVVAFLIRTDAEQPTATDDGVIFYSTQSSEVGVIGCGSGTGVLQQYVLVDPTGTRSERREGIISVTSRPLQPNTRLGNLTFSAFCSIGDVLYSRYEGTVQ